MNKLHSSGSVNSLLKIHELTVKNKKKKTMNLCSVRRRRFILLLFPGAADGDTVE